MGSSIAHGNVHHLERYKRQLSSEELLNLSPEELCKDRLSEEYFRLTWEGDCRDVVRCDRAGLAGTIRLAAVRCPAGLAFDINRQTCDWKAKVENCDRLSKPRRVLPNLKTDEPVCPDGQLQSFNGAINTDNIDLFQEIFNGERQNPNGCSLKGSFYVSHKYTNYSAVQELHRRGHEIGVFSITNKEVPNYWTDGTYDDWLAEMSGDRSIIERFANITDGSVIGVRAPSC